MAHDEFRLLAAAVTLERFTAAELASAAQTNPHTARSWLQRQDNFFTKHQARVGARGRPRNIHSVKDGAAEEMRRQLDALHRQTNHGALASEQQRLLDGVERRYQLWRTAADGQIDDARPQLTALRVAIQLAWRTFARLEAFGESADHSRLRQLAEVERTAGLVSPPMDFDLRKVALWLAERLERLVRQEIAPTFASRTMWLRSEARDEADRRKITAAALAAPVWSDEGLATNDIPESALARCRTIAELVPIDKRLERASRAIKGGGGLCDDDGEAQAVVRGLTACADSRSAMLRDWLVASPARSDWRPALAPIVVHGLLDMDDVVLPTALGPMRDALAATLYTYKGAKGRLRTEAFDFSERVLNFDLGPRRILHAVETTPAGTTAGVQPPPRLARQFGSRATAGASPFVTGAAR